MILVPLLMLLIVALTVITTPPSPHLYLRLLLKQLFLPSVEDGPPLGTRRGKDAQAAEISLMMH
jgi:hypothetical protein